MPDPDGCWPSCAAVVTRTAGRIGGRPSIVGLLWLSAFALSLRCFFESVMVAFYLGPPLAVIVLTAALGASRPRLAAVGAVAMVATVFAFHRFSEWGYWVPMVALLAADPPVGRGWVSGAKWPGRSPAAGHRSEGAAPGRPGRGLTGGHRRPRRSRRPDGYSGPTVCFRPGSSSRAVASVERASATTDRVDAGSITASTNPRSEAW